MNKTKNQMGDSQLGAEVEVCFIGTKRSHFGTFLHILLLFYCFLLFSRLKYHFYGFFFIVVLFFILPESTFSTFCSSKRSLFFSFCCFLCACAWKIYMYIWYALAYDGCMTLSIFSKRNVILLAPILILLSSMYVVRNISRRHHCAAPPDDVYRVPLLPHLRDDFQGAEMLQVAGGNRGETESTDGISRLGVRHRDSVFSSMELYCCLWRHNKNNPNPCVLGLILFWYKILPNIFCTFPPRTISGGRCLIFFWWNLSLWKRS